MQIWGYCADCRNWFVCVRGIDGVVADWSCPVCGLRPVSVEQWDCTEEEHPRLDHPAHGSVVI